MGIAIVSSLTTSKLFTTRMYTIVIIKFYVTSYQLLRENEKLKEKDQEDKENKFHFNYY